MEELGKGIAQCMFAQHICRMEIAKDKLSVELILNERQ